MRFVIDTNVIVSGILFPDSEIAYRLESLFAKHEVLRSETSYAELCSVLQRPKFDRYVSRQKRLEYLTFYHAATTLITMVDSIDVCRDPRDNQFLELAVSGMADIIFTGDADLLVLHPFRAITIINIMEWKE